MTDTLHALADKGTPDWVNVPRNKWGFAVWVIVKFGGWGVLLAFVMYDNYTSKQEIRVDKLEVVQAFRQQIEVNVKMVTVMEGLQKTMEDISRDAREAHRYSRNP